MDLHPGVGDSRPSWVFPLSEGSGRYTGVSCELPSCWRRRQVPAHLEGLVCIRKWTWGFDTISESARRPRGKGSSISCLESERGACHQGTDLHGKVEGRPLKPPGSSGKARTLLMVGCAAMARMAVGRPWKPLDPSETVPWGWQGEGETPGLRGSYGR